MNYLLCTRKGKKCSCLVIVNHSCQNQKSYDWFFCLLQQNLWNSSFIPSFSSLAFLSPHFLFPLLFFFALSLLVLPQVVHGRSNTMGPREMAAINIWFAVILLISSLTTTSLLPVLTRGSCGVTFVNWYHALHWCEWGVLPGDVSGCLMKYC